MAKTNLEAEALIDVERLIEYLGGIPKKTIYKWTWESNTNGFLYYKIGRHLRIRKSEVNAWLRKYKSSQVEQKSCVQFGSPTL